MSQPKRYSVAVNDPWFGNGAYIAEDGKYVLHSDYAAIAAENANLKALQWETLKERNKAEAENERLRKAGDAMAYIMEYEKDNEFDGFVAAWNAAKEGRDANGCFVNHNKVAQYLPKPNTAKEGDSK